jgi:hypothetical protein
MEARIVSYCKIKNNSVCINGEKINIDNKSVDFPSFLVNLYRQMNLNYPKFFKMDNLCKLGILATEMVIPNGPEFDNYEKEKVAIFLSNNSSSVETDRNHINTISDKNQYFPSPAVFVYTLPNIIIGEIAIKHKFTGENAFFVTEKFDENLMYTYVSSVFQNNHTTSAICGWVNVDGNDWEAFLYNVEKNNFNQAVKESSLPHDSETICKLFKKNI